MNTIILENVGPNLYCIAEVVKGKKYRIIGEPDARITFSYAITDDEHSDILFMGPRLHKEQDCLNFTHTITAAKTGHLCIKNYITQKYYWNTMTISVEEI